MACSKASLAPRDGKVPTSPIDLESSTPALFSHLRINPTNIGLHLPTPRLNFHQTTAPSSAAISTAQRGALETHASAAMLVPAVAPNIALPPLTASPRPRPATNRDYCHHCRRWWLLFSFVRFLPHVPPTHLGQPTWVDGQGLADPTPTFASSRSTFTLP